MNDEWVDCKHIFSNGTKFELFVEQCFECSYYRNSHCKILNRCFMAQWDEKYFPYEWLLEHYKYGGKHCKRKTTEPLKKHIRVSKNQLRLDEVN